MADHLCCVRDKMDSSMSWCPTRTPHLFPHPLFLCSVIKRAGVCDGCTAGKEKEMMGSLKGMWDVR